MIDRPLRNVVVVIGNAHHQPCALAEETGDMLEFTEHGDALYGYWTPPSKRTDVSAMCPRKNRLYVLYSGGRDHWAHDRRANRLSANGQQFVNIHALFFV
jgi:hypothetical protein